MYFKSSHFLFTRWLAIQHTCQSLLFLKSVSVRERERLMVWFTLFFIVTLTVVSKVTSLHCSDQQLPSSGDDDLQQVTTLQFCLVDNCTIMMIDTGEELNIVYTTDTVMSLLLPQLMAVLPWWLLDKKVSYLVLSLLACSQIKYSLYNFFWWWVTLLWILQLMGP